MRHTGTVLHLRLIVPPDLRPEVDAVLEAAPGASNFVVLADAARRPRGDVILCDVEREAASRLLEALHGTGLGDRGSITAEHIDLAIDRTTRRRQGLRFGGEDDAVVWEEVEARTNDEVRLSGTFLAFMTVATMIAAVGVVADQPILIVGAMVVGPDFGPLAAIAVGLVRRRWTVAGRSVLTLVVGYTFAIIVTIGFASVLKAVGVFPADPFAEEHPLTEFIWSPDALSYVVAFLAGIAGMLSLTSSKSGALIGVLISVTTVPAAGAIALAVTAGVWEQVRTSSLQLAINLTWIVLGACLTLLLQIGLQRFGERWRAARALRRAGVAGAPRP